MLYPTSVPFFKFNLFAVCEGDILKIMWPNAWVQIRGYPGYSPTRFCQEGLHIA